MRTAQLAAVFTALFLTTGCIVVADDDHDDTWGGVVRGDLTLFYTFDGRPCATAGVTSVQIDVEGVDTSDGYQRTVSCSAFSQGITIGELVEGTYDVFVTGLSDGRVVYTGAPVRVRVHGNVDNEYTIDVPGTAGDLTVWWGNFGGLGCAAAGVEELRISLYDAGGVLVDDADYLTCADAGFTWELLSAGTYRVVLDAFDGGGYVLYGATVDLQVRAGQANEYTVDLAALGGELTVWWTFEGSPVCGEVDEVHVVLVDPWGYTFDDNAYPCDYEGVIYGPLEEGTWTVSLYALDDLGYIVYEAEDAAVPVWAGETNEYTVDLLAY